MMKKSSLGRRSSVLSQGRASYADKNNIRFANEGKKSLIPKPCYQPKTGRSSSVEREFNSSALKKDAPPSGLRRSRSFLDFGRVSTPCYTPVQYNARNTGSVYRTQMSEGGRPSSVGGLRSAKKESRPITEKSFQTLSQQKIQEFFMAKAPDLLEKGTIKPMTLSMFADMVNFLIQPHEQLIVVNRNNPMEGVLQICKLFNYRGKAEKSWLRTVNTPHSWPHVVAFLVWLVELYQIAEALNVMDTMYPDDPEGQECEQAMEDFDFKLLVPHLLRGYNKVYRQRPPGDDAEEMRQFIIEQKKALNVDESEIIQLQTRYQALREELENCQDANEENLLKKLEEESKMLIQDINKTKEFICEAEEYIHNLEEKRDAVLHRIEKYEKAVNELKAQKAELEATVAGQAMSAEQKKNIESEAAALQNRIQQLNDEKQSYQDEVYKVDLRLVGLRNAYTKEVNEYNKTITLNLLTMPELKSVQIDENLIKCMDAPNAVERFVLIDKELNEMKAHLKSQINDAEVKLEAMKLQHAKADDSLQTRQEAYEKLQNECAQVENEIALLKKQMSKDKELTATAIAEMQKKIKIEKERLDDGQFEEEEELKVMKDKYEKTKLEYEDFKRETLKSLNNRLKNLITTRAKLQEIIRDSMAERKNIIKEILDG